MITVAVDLLSHHNEQIPALIVIVELTRLEMNKSELLGAQIQRKLREIYMHSIREFIKEYYKVNHKLED